MSEHVVEKNNENTTRSIWRQIRNKKEGRHLLSNPGAYYTINREIRNCSGFLLLLFCSISNFISHCEIRMHVLSDYTFFFHVRNPSLTHFSTKESHLHKLLESRLEYIYFGNKLLSSRFFFFLIFFLLFSVHTTFDCIEMQMNSIMSNIVVYVCTNEYEQ